MALSALTGLRWETKLSLYGDTRHCGRAGEVFSRVAGKFRRPDRILRRATIDWITAPIFVVLWLYIHSRGQALRAACIQDF